MRLQRAGAALLFGSLAIAAAALRDDIDRYRTGHEAAIVRLLADMTTPADRAVVAAAGATAGTPVGVLPMVGGSVPIHMFDTGFGVPIIGLPIVNHDNNQHAANENLRLQNLWDGIGAYAAMIAGLDW